MFDSFKRGWAMAKASWTVLKDQPSLAVFPVMSAVAAVVLTAVLAIPVAFGGAAVSGMGLSDRAVESLGYLALFAWYFVCTFAVVFCNAALIACALQKFAGQQTSVSYGLAAAARRLPQILGWTLIASTIGVALQGLQSVLSEKAGLLGNLLAGLSQAVWGVATYFAVPVVVTEGLGPIAAVKRSWALIRRSWGESLSGSAGLNVIAFLLLLPAFAIVALGVTTSGGTAVLVTLGTLAALYGVLLLVVFAALGAIFRSAVYHYATTGVAPGRMDADLLQSTFRHT